MARSRSRSFSWLTACLALSALAAIPGGCGSSSDDESPKHCTPGSTRACVGTNQCEGTQRCVSASEGWSECACGGTGGEAGTGGAGGSNATGGSGAAGESGSAGRGGTAGGGGTTGSGGTTGGGGGDGGAAGDGGGGVGAVGPGFSCDARTGSLPALELAPVVSGLDAPVAVVSPPGRPDTLFIVEQSGTIRIFDAGQLEATPFLDVQGLVRFGGEEGLLGLAFHPDYADNGRFFIHYSAATDGASTVMEYARSASNPNLADPTPVQLVVQTPTAQTNNNGGDVEFGGDGYLYVALGDGGAQNDPGCDAQNLQNFLGKILRLDVDGTPDQNGYPAAPGNPVGQKFYHVGLRNPWRLSFDRCTQDLYIGDVGQDTWEEVDVAPSASGALNFGWPMREGLHAHTNDCVSPPSNVVEPIAEFEHLDGRCSIIGGHVYRGSAIPSLRGSYICGDFCNGAIYSLRYDSGSVTSGPTLQSIQVGSQALSAFGQDGNGEIYVVDHGGSITRIAPN